MFSLTYKNFILIFIYLFFVRFATASQHLVIPEVTLKQLQDHVAILTSDLLGGRLTGSFGETIATMYIAYEFFQLHLIPAGDDQSYFQLFQLPDSVRPSSYLNGRNVLAKLMIASKSKKVIVIGAHADHLGYGETDASLADKSEKNTVHSGADDNASGVAAMLMAASILSELKAKGLLHGDKDILFAAWSGEELGLLGSSHFLKKMNHAMQPRKTLSETVVAYINLDMIGRLREHLLIQGVASSSKWPKLIHKLQQHYSLSIVSQPDPYLPTDSTSFYLKKIPTVNFFTGAHSEYHTPRDKPETLNYLGMQQTTEVLLGLILALEETADMDYQEVNKPVVRFEGGLKVYLGTIPDYADSEMRVKLSGVIKGSPAERAGVQSGDVILALAGKKIQSINEYSFVLNSLKVGKPVEMIVLRGQVKKKLMVIGQLRE